MTADATADDRDRVMSAGFDAHVRKPFDPPALVTVISELLSRGPDVE